MWTVTVTDKQTQQSVQTISRSSDPCSNTYTSSAQICTYVTANPTSPLALADCDNGGISNIIECQNGGDPLSPSDDCNVINSGVVDICDTWQQIQQAHWRM
ncbi:MAG: hypothetical protein IPJ43_17175 [Saprospiraceae bacterium]|nr:hypothetical protein [Saprospiraceae bacterium]